MQGTFLPYVAALAAANLLALGAMLAPRRRTRARAAEAREPQPVLDDDPLEALVREVEATESASRFGAPGEAQLAEDIRRWRRRYADGGDPLPLAAGGGRESRRVSHGTAFDRERNA